MHNANVLIKYSLSSRVMLLNVLDKFWIELQSEHVGEIPYLQITLEVNYQLLNTENL